MPVEIAITIGSILAVVATVLAYIFIIPENKREGLNKFLKWVHDVCNFKLLYIEHILKALYILETAFCLIAGFLMLFSVIDAYFFTVYIGWVGLLVMIVGPIITRLIYEALMLAVLHLKATREINDKLVIQPGSVAEQKEKERIKAEQEAAERARLAQQQQLAQQQFAQQQYQQQIAQQQSGTAAAPGSGTAAGSGSGTAAGSGSGAAAERSELIIQSTYTEQGAPRLKRPVFFYTSQ